MVRFVARRETCQWPQTVVLDYLLLNRCGGDMIDYLRIAENSENLVTVLRMHSMVFESAGDLARSGIVAALIHYEIGCFLFLRLIVGSDLAGLGVLQMVPVR